MRRCCGWVIVMPGGGVCRHTLRRTHRDAIQAWTDVVAAGAWLAWRDAGYRCVKVELRLVEKPKRRGGGR